MFDAAEYAITARAQIQPAADEISDEKTPVIRGGHVAPGHPGAVPAHRRGIFRKYGPAKRAISRTMPDLLKCLGKQIAQWLSAGAARQHISGRGDYGFIPKIAATLAQTARLRNHVAVTAVFFELIRRQQFNVHAEFTAYASSLLEDSPPRGFIVFGDGLTFHKRYFAEGLQDDAVGPHAVSEPHKIRKLMDVRFHAQERQLDSGLIRTQLLFPIRESLQTGDDLFEAGRRAETSVSLRRGGVHTDGETIKVQVHEAAGDLVCQERSVRDGIDVHAISLDGAQHLKVKVRMKKSFSPQAVKLQRLHKGQEGDQAREHFAGHDPALGRVDRVIGFRAHRTAQVTKRGQLNRKIARRRYPMSGQQSGNHVGCVSNAISNDWKNGRDFFQSSEKHTRIAPRKHVFCTLRDPNEGRCCVLQ